MNPLYHVGRYSQLMYRCFFFFFRTGEVVSQALIELDRLGVSSLFITLIVSLFMGAVLTIQTQNNIENPLLPDYTVGLVTRDTLLLEFCSMVLCLFLAGNIGSNIASQIGTMRISEQIDAMDIMGVNSANYIILPKIVAVVLYIPVLVVFSMFTGMLGGYLIAAFTDIITTSKFIYGLQYWFIEWYVYYSLIKAAVFAFIIASVSAYWGYFVRGGTLEVGKASTRAVVTCSVLILLADVVLTQILLL